MTFRPSARPTTPCAYGVVGFGGSTYRGTELPSELYVFEQQAPALYAMDPLSLSRSLSLSLSLYAYAT